MSVWWLAIDEAQGNASYEELRERRVVAQGWPDLGDLQAGGRLAQLRTAPEQYRPGLLSGWLQQAYPDKDFNNIIGNLVNFFCGITAGDFVIGRPGQKVAGICEMPPNPRYTYDDQYDYSHGLGPVTWYNWDDVSPAWRPSPPVQLHGSRRVGNGHDRVEALFSEFLQRKRRLREMDEWAEIVTQQSQIILTGPPGTGRTLEAKRLAGRLITGQVPPIQGVDQILSRLWLGAASAAPEAGGGWDIVQFHPSYNYDDFVCGIRMSIAQPGIPSYEVRDGPLLRIADAAQRNTGATFVLIIDEINRANVAAVLGELIYALEYRGRPIRLQYGSRDAIVPKNVFIIGTMNTADRSIGHLDYAVRRRFAFIPLKPERGVVDKHYADGVLRTYALLKFDEVSTLFIGERSLLTPDYRADAIAPGHSYFLADGEGDLARAALNRKIKYQVVPLLREYVADGVLRAEAAERIDRLENELTGGDL
jgi:hypothetical protein